MNIGSDGSISKDYLSLCAQTFDDVNVISSLAQDSIVVIKNIKWIKKRHRFSMLINRFRWEYIDKNDKDEALDARVQATLIFDGVLNVSSQGIEFALKNEILSLLQIKLTESTDENTINIIFSGKTAIKLETEFTRILLKDISPLNVSTNSSIPKHKI